MEKHVLVVEDDNDILEMVEYLLSSNGLRVHGAGSVKQFWERLSRHTPDVILLDIMLPDGNGLELCMQLKASDATKHIPIVLMSANFSQKELEGKPCGHEFISKPFNIHDLIGKVQKQIA